MSKTTKQFKTVPRIDIELLGMKGSKKQIEADQCEKLADRFKVEYTPTAIVFKNGVEVGRVESMGDNDRDFELMQKLLEANA